MSPSMLRLGGPVIFEVGGSVFIFRQVSLGGDKKGCLCQGDVSCLPNLDLSTISVKFFIVVIMVLSKFDINNHVIDVPAKYRDVYEVMCLLCPVMFKKKSNYPVKNHMEKTHGYQFEVQRNRKRESEGECEATAAKQSNSALVIKANCEEYKNVLALHQASNLLPYSYWNSETSKYIQSPYEKHFGIEINGDTMRAQNITVEKQLKVILRKELCGRIVSIMFDIGSKHRRSFLGVSVQYMVGMVVHIIHLGMVVMVQRNTSKYIESRILEILADFEVELDQIHALVTDNGNNVIRTSKDVLVIVMKHVKELLSTTQESDNRDALDAIVAAEANARAAQIAEELQVDEDQASIDAEYRAALDAEEQAALEANQQAQLLGNDFGVDVFGEETDEDNDPDLVDDIIEHELTMRVEQDVQIKGTSVCVIPIRCAAHTVQLAVYDGLALYNTEVEDMKKKCGDIRRAITKDRLGVTLPQQSNTTRWSSTFKMVDGMVSVKDKVEKEMTTNQWLFAGTMKNVLNPFQKLTTQLQAEQYVFGDLVRDIITCQVDLMSMTEPFALTLQETLHKRKEVLLDPSNLTLQAALFMDHRFNNKTSTSWTPETRKEIVEYLLNLYDRIQRVKKRASLPETKTSNNQRKLSPDHIRNMHILMREVPEAVDDTQKDLRSQLENFGLNVKRPDFNEFNVQKYWKDHWNIFPELAELANVVLPVPASQVSVERAFSVLSLIFGNRRTKINNTNLERLLFIRLNQKFIPRPVDFIK